MVRGVGYYQSLARFHQVCGGPVRFVMSLCESMYRCGSNPARRRKVLFPWAATLPRSYDCQVRAAMGCRVSENRYNRRRARDWP